MPDPASVCMGMANLFIQKAALLNGGLEVRVRFVYLRGVALKSYCNEPLNW